MPRFPISQGFGQAGLAVTNAGRMFWFDPPVSKVVIRNEGPDDVLVGINGKIPGGAENIDEPTYNTRYNPAEGDVQVETLSEEQALAKGVELPISTEMPFEIPLDATADRRIRNIWAVTRTAEAATIQGGALSL